MTAGGAHSADAPDWSGLAETLRTLEVFDAGWYADRFPDVTASGMDPALHYVKYGAAMGRDPGPAGSLAHWLDNGAGANGDEPSTALLRGLVVKPSSAAPARKPAKPRKRRRKTRTASTIKRKLAPYLPARLFPRAAILEANTAIGRGDRAGWARAMQRYLFLQDAPPFRVSDGPDNILDAITFAEAPKIESGPLVSVIMPTWNAEKTVAYAVRSILEQTWRPLELIVVDDASTDGTPAILDRLAAGDPRMTVLRNVENAGPYVSKNIGLHAARGTFITGHDADDLALPCRIERQVAFLRENGHRCGFIGMLRLTEDGRITRLGGDPPNSADGVAATAFISLMIERDLMKGILGHWDVARFGADSELDKRLIRAMGGGELPRLHEVGLLALDNPGGLTNHPTQGRISGRISPLRRAYRDRFNAWHRTVRSQTAWLPFPHEPRRFKAPAKALNAPGVVERVVAEHVRARPDLLDRVIDCDVCILTTLRFPGGNCSSTIDEVRFLTKAGLRATLVHCATDDRLDPVRAFERADRYAEWSDHIVPWYEIDRLVCRHLIVRHPRALLSRTFDRIASRIKADHLHVVVNNASHRPNGQCVYAVDCLVDRVRSFEAGTRRIIPIGPLIRADIDTIVPPDLLSDTDWSPTFDAADYALPARDSLTPPFVVGRHGRDAPEKWVQDPSALRAAYPSGPDFKISILGGAEEVAAQPGGVPENWQVADFGTIPPKAFLATLDVFAYFPHTDLAEAFGRTIVEAMIASRPVILPPRFEATFGDLAFYSEPQGVAAVIRTLSDNWAEARVWLAAVQRAAIGRYASQSIATRLPDLEIATDKRGDPAPLSDHLMAFKRRIEAAGQVVVTGP